MTEVESIAALAREGREVKIIKISDGHVATTVAAVPKGVDLQSIKKLLDEYRAKPERRSGCATAHDLDSFISYTNRYKAANSAVFGDADRVAPSLLTVFDQHPEGGDNEEALFGRHRVRYPFPVSDEWRAWLEHNDQMMSQGDFASFIENRILDVIPAEQEMDGRTGEVRENLPEDVARFLAVAGGKVASPQRIMELSRGLAIRSDERVKHQVNLSSGEAQLQYESQHVDTQGAPVTVPNLFLIAIPVFRNGAHYKMPVRLRYRVAGGKIVWAYEIYRHEQVFDHAFREACGRVREETGLPLFLGQPEAQ